MKSIRRLSVVLALLPFLVGTAPDGARAAPPKHLGTTTGVVLSDQTRFAVAAPKFGRVRILDFKTGSTESIAASCDLLSMDRATPALVSCVDAEGRLGYKLLEPRSRELRDLPTPDRTSYGTIGRQWVYGVQFDESTAVRTDVYVNWHDAKVVMAGPTGVVKPRDIDDRALTEMDNGDSVGFGQTVGAWRLEGAGAGFRLRRSGRQILQRTGSVSGIPTLTARALTWSESGRLYAYLSKSRRLIRWTSRKEHTRPLSIAQLGPWAILAVPRSGLPDDGVRVLRLKRLRLPMSS